MMTSSVTKTLQRLKKASEKASSVLTEPLVPPTSQEALPYVPELSLEEFSKARLVVRVKSSVLQEEEVLFASDNALVNEEAGLVVYRASELRRLLSSTPEALRDLHHIKSVFRGSRVTEMNLEEPKT